MKTLAAWRLNWALKRLYDLDVKMERLRKKKQAAIKTYIKKLDQYEKIKSTDTVRG